MAPRYDWILFDADHTLFDFDKASEEALAEVLLQHGFNWQEGMYEDYKRINVQCWMEHEEGRMDRDTLVYERFRRYFDFMKLDLDPLATQDKYLKALGSRPYLMPGAKEIISLLGPHVGLGYITNGMSTVQRPRLELIGWHIMFDVIVIAGEIGCSKPHFDYFHHVHQQMNEPDKSKVLVVGDSLTADIAGGASYGYHTCWYNPGSVQCAHEHQPDYTIAQLDELERIVLDH